MVRGGTAGAVPAADLAAVAGWQGAQLRALRDAVLAGDPGCVADPELFTGPSGIEPEDEPEPERAARINAARQVCADCPVRLPCLAWAVRSLPAAGVWAGLVPEEIAFLAGAANRPARPGGLAEVA
jgi:WhiB family redox-sensing transcriptional regulator